jgi:hypothetical protein
MWTFTTASQRRTIDLEYATDDELVELWTMLTVKLSGKKGEEYINNRKESGPKVSREVFTYDTKPVWKRTIDGLVFADFLDGNGIMKTNTRALQNGDKTWAKYSTGAFRYVFKEDRVLLESSYHGSLRYFKLSETQSKKVRDFYGEA